MTIINTLTPEIIRLIKQEKFILTDADGVLLNWEWSFKKWMMKQGFQEFSTNSYDMHVRYQMERPRVKDLIREFNECAWIGWIPALPGARQGVQIFAEQGYRFGVVTSLSNDLYASKLRAMNLHNLFGDIFEFVQCIDTGADKDQALMPYKDSGCIWVEDKPENAKLGADLGLNTYLVRHEHNANFDYEGVTKIDNWVQLANRVV